MPGCTRQQKMFWKCCRFHRILSTLCVKSPKYDVAAVFYIHINLKPLSRKICFVEQDYYEEIYKRPKEEENTITRQNFLISNMPSGKCRVFF